MTEVIKKHWRYGGKITHIGVEALPNGENIDVEIEKIEYKNGVTINGQKQDAWICTFKKNQYFKLPMVLNATNRKRICRMAGTNYPEEVKNFKVTLTKEMDRIPGEGIKDWCLRVSPTAPKAASYEDEINALIQSMDECKTLEELAKTWNESKYKTDPKIVVHKDNLKKLLQ